MPRKKPFRAASDAALLECGLLKDVPAAIVGALLRRARRRGYSPGEVIIYAGALVDRVHILVRGRTKATLLDRSGMESILWVGPGQLLGLTAFVPKPVTSPLGFQAITECETLEWEKAEMLAVGRRCPRLFENAIGLAYAWFSVMASSYQATNSYSVEQRLAYTLSNLARQYPESKREDSYETYVDVIVSNQELASMVGCNSTAFTVSRVLRRWERAGLTEKKGRHVRILSLGKLLSLCKSSANSETRLLFSALPALTGILALSSCICC